MKVKNIKGELKNEEIDQYDYIDYEIENKVITKFSEYIGKFLIRFNSLEHELNLAIAYVFIDDMVHEGYLIIKDLMFRNKIELFKDLYSTRIYYTEKNKDKAQKKLKEIYDNLILLNTFRNCIVHADWLTLDKENFVRTKISVDNDGGYVKGQKVKIIPSLIKSNLSKMETIINHLDEIQEYI